MLSKWKDTRMNSDMKELGEPNQINRTGEKDGIPII